MGVADVTYSLDGAIGVITLDRPPVNAYTGRTMAALDAAWSEAAADDAARVIVLRAEGQHFSAGGDLAVSGENHQHMPPEDAWTVQREIPKPSIAAVQGACVAGGQRMIWVCDLIVASEDAFFSDPLLRYGLPGIPAQGHPWEYGPRAAKEMLYTASRIPAEQARRYGMVNRVVRRDRLDAEAFALAREIAEMDPFALASVKRAVNRTMDIIGQQYIANRFAELMDGFSMDTVHERHETA
jgi:enoyl-CoA hydratase